MQRVFCNFQIAGLDLHVQAVVHNLDNLFLVHVLADEHQADNAVAVLFVPDFLELRIFGEHAFLFGLAFGGKPLTEVFGGGLLAGLFEQVAIVAFIAEPHKTLGTDDACRIVVEEFFELFSVQRTVRFVNERANAIFVTMRMVLVVVVPAVAYPVLVIAMAVVLVIMVMVMMMSFGP